MDHIDLTCSRCGAPMTFDPVRKEAVCEYCGHRIFYQETVPLTTPQPERLKFPKKWIAVAAAVCILLAIGIVVGTAHKDSSSEETPIPTENGIATLAPTENGIATPAPTKNAAATPAPTKNAAATLATAKNLNVGDIVTFGRYEQDNDAANGQEDIEWQVLAVEDGKALLLSKYALDCQPYNEEYSDVTWETCTLRRWLNEDFLSTAFSSDEAAEIVTTTVTADKNPDYDIDPGNDTQDQVFLLSIPEAGTYFCSKQVRMCVPTEYAIAQGANTASDYFVNGKATCYWWLRSPGYESESVAVVYYDGSAEFYGDIVDFDNVCVRPALWVNLES